MNFKQEELIVLVDEHNIPLGTAPKLASHNANTPLHRGFSVFLFNNKREVLLQQRSRLKKTWPLVWSNSCCGHPKLGESIKNAAKRRLFYELGIKKARVYVVDPLFRYKCEKDGIAENEICPILVAFTSELPKPNPKEVENTRWVLWPKLLEEVAENPDAFSPWCVLETELLKSNKKIENYFK